MQSVICKNLPSSHDIPPSFIENLSGFLSRNVSRHAFMETLCFLSCALLLNILLGDGTRFIHMPLHPFWVIVLLVTVQYGQGEAIMAAVLSSLFLLVGNLPEQTFTETLYEYIFRVSYLPLLWIVTALVLGSIRARQLQDRKNTAEKFQKCKEALKTIADGYNAMKRAKEQLEMRLARERCSVLSVYSIAKSLETVDPLHVHMEVAKLIRLAFSPDKFSIFLCEGDSGLRLKESYGWNHSHPYSDRFAPDTQCFRSIVRNKRFLSILCAEDEPILNGQGMLAGPILDTRTGTVFGMLKIENIAFMDLGMRNQEIFQIVCKWAGRIYANVEKYRNSHPITKEASNDNSSHLDYISDRKKATVAV